MPHPLLLEINTRCWLRALSDSAGHPLTLENVPEMEIDGWKKRGFTHVWLMGVWATGPRTRQMARSNSSLRAQSAEAFGTTDTSEMLDSSTFAVEDFTVAGSFGGPESLRAFRAKLQQRGLALVLDFIPNHLGVDHPWVTERTGLFVHSAERRPGTFPVDHDGRTLWVAHGKDPYFPPWGDTAQLDYRRAETRAAMLETLLSIASQCDGVRCDMAMLLLNDIFDKNWQAFPSDGPAASGEFWDGAIAAVKQRQPAFTFLAEAYWETEPRLAKLGFDYIYDKKFLDHLVKRDYPALQSHLRDMAGKFQPARFLENHDEARIASIFTAPEQKAAAVFLLAQPGLRLLLDGQTAGWRHRTPVQFARYWPEHGDPEIAAFYENLFSTLPRTAIGHGEMEWCETGLAACFAMKWTDQTDRRTFALVNLAPDRASFPVRPGPSEGQVAHILSAPDSTWTLKDGELHIELAGHGYALLELRPA